MNVYDWLLLLAANKPISSLRHVCVRNDCISYRQALRALQQAKTAKHLAIEKNNNSQGQPLSIAITPLGREYLHSKGFAL